MNEKCIYCEREFIIRKKHRTTKLDRLDKTRDHLIPVKKGGNGSKYNLRDACYQCNSTKGSMLLEEFLEWITDKLIAKDYRKYNRYLLVVMYSNVKKLISEISEHKINMVKESKAV